MHKLYTLCHLLSRRRLANTVYSEFKTKEALELLPVPRLLSCLLSMPAAGAALPGLAYAKLALSYFFLFKSAAKGLYVITSCRSLRRPYRVSLAQNSPLISFYSKVLQKGYMSYHRRLRGRSRNCRNGCHCGFRPGKVFCRPALLLLSQFLSFPDCLP